jgi:hypothetical protein
MALSSRRNRPQAYEKTSKRLELHGRNYNPISSLQTVRRLLALGLWIQTNVLRVSTTNINQMFSNLKSNWPQEVVAVIKIMFLLRCRNSKRDAAAKSLVYALSQWKMCIQREGEIGICPAMSKRPWFTLIQLHNKHNHLASRYLSLFTSGSWVPFQLVLWRIWPLLSNCSVNTFPQLALNNRASIARQRLNKHLQTNVQKWLRCFLCGPHHAQCRVANQ